jgi:transposase
MRSSENETSPGEAPRETMTMSEAASLLGVSVLTVRRMCKAYETSGEKEGLAFAWTSPNSSRTDIRGRRLRGHRRPFADAVRETARLTGRIGGEWGTQNLPDEHS